MKTRAHTTLFPVILAIALTLAAGAALAQDEDLGEGRERHLNGHGFLPSLYVGDPFVASTFQNHTGGGVAMDYQTVFNDLEGEPLFTLEGNVFFASLGLGYQQNLGRRWAVGLQGSADIRAGTNAETFISDGADVDRNGALWAAFRLTRGEKSQTAVGLDWSYSKVTFFTPGDFARHIADGGSLEDAPIVVSEKVWTTRIVVNWAYAVNPRFGFRLNGGFGLYEPPLTSGVAKASHRVGGLAEYDFHPGGGLPIGLTLGYTQALPDDDPYTGQSGTLFGLWYTGKEAFVVGVEGGAMKFPVENQTSDKVKSMFGVITLRYYF
jgi:opacity protein-like surface antigen